MIRVLLEYVDAKLKGKENPVAKFFIKWVNRSCSSKKLSVDKQDKWKQNVFFYYFEQSLLCEFGFPGVSNAVSGALKNS